jgi:bacteriocin biosynthesis cyclodehydratase domain-containing protein
LAGYQLKLRQGARLRWRAGEPPACDILLNGRTLRLAGRSAARILELLDGAATPEALWAAVGPDARRDLHAALVALRRRGLLEPDLGDPSCPRAVAAQPLVRALSDVGVDGMAVFGELRRARVVVVSSAALEGALVAAIERCGIGSCRSVRLDGAASADAGPAFADADVAVVAADAPDPGGFEAFNALALRDKLPWLAVELGPFSVQVGPFVLPGETACYACYRGRLDPDLASLDGGRATQQGPRVADNVTSGALALAAELSGLELTRYFASRVSSLAPAVYDGFADYSLLSHRATVRPVLRLPRCPACGVRAAGQPTVRAWMEPYEHAQD